MNKEKKPPKFLPLKFNLWLVLKKGWNSFSRHKKLNFPIILIMGFAISLGVSFQELNTYQTDLQERAILKGNFADVIIHTEEILLEDAISIANNVSDLYSEIEFRVIIPVLFEFGEDNTKFTGYIIGIDTSRESHINQLINETGSKIDHENGTLNYEFVKDHSKLVEKNSLKIGTGFFNKEYTINNIGYSCEWTQLNSQNIGEGVSFDSIPVFYLDFSHCAVFFSGQIYINQILAKNSSSSSPGILKNALLEEFEGQTKIGFTKSEYPPIQINTKYVNSYTKVINYISYILLISATIVLLVVLSRTIDEDLKQIGILNALGASKKEIFSSYLAYIFIIDIFGLLISLFFSIIFASLWTSIFLSILNMPSLGYFILPSYKVMKYFIILLILSYSSSFFIIRKTSTIDPMDLIRNEVKFTQKTSIFEKIIIKINSKFSPFGKYNLRRIINQKGFSAFTISVLTISICLLITSSFLINIVPYSIEKKYNETELWDGYGECVDFIDNKTFSNSLFGIYEIDDLSYGIKENIQLVDSDLAIRINSGENISESEISLEYINLLAYQNSTNLHNFPIIEGRKYNNEFEVILSIDFKYKTNYSIGDTITLKSPELDLYNIHTYKIVGFVNDLYSKMVYLPLSEAQTLLNQTNKINVFYFTIKENSYENSIYILLRQTPYIQSLKSKEEMKIIWDKILSILNDIFPTMAFLVIILTILIMLTITKSIISYRTHDYANFKSIGIYFSDIRRAIWMEMMIFMIISIIISIPIGNFLLDNLLEISYAEMPGMFNEFKLNSYLYIGGSAIIVIFIGTFSPLNSIKNLELARILREKNFG